MSGISNRASRRLAVLAVAAVLSGAAVPAHGQSTTAPTPSGESAAPPAGVSPATSPVTGLLQEETTVGNLLRACRAGVGNGLMYCYGYIGGVIDVHRRTIDAYPDAARFCAPRLKAEQRRRVFLEWALRATDSYGARAIDGVELALIEKFPCSRGLPPR